MFITWLAEDMGGQPGNQETSARWADEFDLTFPVLADPQWVESFKYRQDSGIPSFYLLGRDLTIRILDQYVTGADIQEALAEPWPEVEWEQPPDLEELAEQLANRNPEGDASGDVFAAGGDGTPFGGCAASIGGRSPVGFAWLLTLLGALGLRRIRRKGPLSS